jgi:hypothetical protein
MRHGASVWRVPQPTDRLMTSKQASQNSCKIGGGPERRISRRDHSRHPANHTECVATEALRFKQQRKARTDPSKLSERVANILGVEPSLAVAQAADEGAAR